MVGHRRLSKRSGEEYQLPYLCIYLERCPSVTCDLLPILAVGACLPQRRIWSNKLLYKAWSVKWAAHLPLPCCAHATTFPLAARGSRGNCLVSWPQANKFTKAGGSRALVIHILASATADVALISTAPVYLCLPCWSNDKNWEHSNFPIKTHNTCCWRASGRKVEGNKRQLYPGHSLLYFNYQIFIYSVLLMTLWLKKHAWS